MRRSLQSICLINPKRDAWSKTERITAALRESHEFLKAYYSPSLSLLTVAALTPAEVRIELVNEDFAAIDYEAAYDLVGLTAMTQTAERAYSIADRFRAKGIHVVMGGIHATVLPEEAARHADTVVVGEAEELWPRFLEDYRNGEPQRIYRHPPGHRVELKLSPVPRYDLLRGRESFLDPRRYYNFVPLQVSRGCPHDCEFCLVSEVYGKRARVKTMEQVRAEILSIKQNVPNRLVLFADDNLFLDRPFARRLLRELADLKVRWISQSDISIGEDDELLDEIYRAGCLFLLVGFESLDPANLSGMNRNNWKLRQLRSYERNLRNIQEHGIIVFGSFIFGLDHDDAGVFARVVDFMNRNRITGQMTIATPLPGSRMYERLKAEGRFLYPEPFWDRCTFLDVIFDLRNMSRQEAEDGFIWAYRSIFNEEAFRDRAAYLKDVYKRLN